MYRNGIPKGFFETLFVLAGIGLIAAVIGGGWLTYHLIRAVLFYVGAL
ncbi:hypothetical protein D584_16555 [Brucella intermedia M86]|uniref:Uncharacterized protein n=1 Tax=Brucella intermedia M86 TaxID=1234597 RepID=M5JME2_9HYPH|nr:hypothetical protein D584_16555 [Brucella intermedia M86]